MVCAVSNERSTFVLRHMPYARGLQWRDIYWQSKGIETEPLSSEDSSQTIMQ
jgi:hypothetical protein